MKNPEKLKEGDRIKLFDGYDPEPEWLQGNTHYFGTIISFIPGQNREPATVVRLDQKISIKGVMGDIVILELRYVGAKWLTEGVVHVELCDFVPENKSWSNRKQGKWVESHASYVYCG